MAVPRPTTSGSSGNHRSGAPSQASLGSYVPQENPVWPSYLQVDTQLIPLSIHNIPFHPDFGTRTVSHPNLASFVKTVFDDAKRWNPPSWKQTGKYVENKVGLEPVNISQYMTKKHDRWFARYNEFYDGAHDQHWEELDHVLRDNHSDHEAEYTPDVFDHQCLVKWNEGLDEAERASKMKDISMEITQMYHKMEGLVTNRVFTVLLISGYRTDLGLDPKKTDNMSRQFIVVQLPVALHNFPEKVKQRSFTSTTMQYQPHQPKMVNGQAVQFMLAQQTQIGKNLVQGYYASVEQIGYHSTPPGQIIPPRKSPYISWCMSTASDAGGQIPKFFYKFAVPGKIAQDVKFVCDYIKANRGTKGWPVIRGSE